MITKALFPFIVAAVTFTTTSANNAWAEQKHVNNKSQVTFDLSIDADYHPLTEADFKALDHQAVESEKRSPAAVGDPVPSPELEIFRQTLQEKVKTGADVDPMLDDLDAKYDTYKYNDMKLAAALLVPLRAFKSFYYRMIPVTEGKGNVTHGGALGAAQKEIDQVKGNLSHGAMVAMAQQIATAQRIYLPTPQWTAGFEYVSQPWAHRDADDKVKCDKDQSYHPIDQFWSINDLRNASYHEAYCEILKAYGRVKNLDLQAQPAAWNGQVFYGLSNKIDNFDRYRWVGNAEKNVLLSAMSATLQAIEEFTAYQAPDLFEITQKLGETFGFNLPSWDAGIGVPAEARANALRKFQGRDFIIDPKYGHDLMKNAFGHMSDSITYAQAAWDALKGRPADRWQIVDPSFFTPYGERRGITLSLAKMHEMMLGQTTLHSIVTGETLDVDVKKLMFDDPPGDLLVFLPQTFYDRPEDGDHRGLKYKPGFPKPYRNYLYGSAKTWNLGEYGKYFHNINDTGVETAGRIISQSWGGNVFTPGLALLQ